MTHLIDKDALVAEIEKFEKALKNACKPNPFGNVEECMTAAELQAFDVVKETINTLEVKEVDFSTEIYKYIEEHFNVYDDGNQTLQTKYKKSLIGRVDVENIAKHFFEIGISLPAASSQNSKMNCLNSVH